MFENFNMMIIFWISYLYCYFSVFNIFVFVYVVVLIFYLKSVLLYFSLFLIYYFSYCLIYFLNKYYFRGYVILLLIIVWF